MAQQYQVDIVTKVVGAASVTKLEKALDAVQSSSKAVDNTAEGVATSLQKLKNAAKQSAVNTSKAALALEKLRLANLKASQGASQHLIALQKLRVATAEIDVNSAKAALSANNLGTATQTAGIKAKSSATGFQAMGAAINTAMLKVTAIITAVQTFSKVIGAAFERQNAEKRLQNLTGSAQEYEAALLAAAAISQKFGISQTEATQALGDVYSRLSGVGFGLKEVTTIYEGFNTVAREAGISSQAASSAFLQLGQALGSGVLQGDEMRSILEQMPQLTQLIAEEMGIAASQVKKFGSEGKVTSDIIYRALEKAALGAGDLNGKLTPMQKAMNDFKVATDKASVAVGEVLIPAMTQLVGKLTAVLNKLNDISKSPAFKAIIAPLKAINGIAQGIGDTTDRWAGIQRDANGAIKTGAGETQQLAEAAKDAVEPFSSLPAKAGELKTKLEGSNPPAQEIVEKAGFISEALSGASANGLNLADQLKKMRTEAAGVKKETTSVKEKVEETIAPTKELAMQNAELERQLALQNQLQALKNGQTQTAVGLTQQVAQGEGQAAQNAAQLAENQAGANAQINAGVSAAGRLANNLQRAASASASIGGGGGGGRIKGNSSTRDYGDRIYDMYKLDQDGNIVETTDKERKRQMNSTKVQRINNQKKIEQAWALSGGDTNAAKNAFSARHTGGVIGPTGSQVWREYQKLLPGDRRQSTRYAEGGYVTGPTNALIGEGGEPEYVIPAGKLDGAMQRYSAGMRGSAMIPDSASVNINYSGSTVEMGGTSYINKGDVNGIVSQAVNATLTTLKKSPRARLEAGLR